MIDRIDCKNCDSPTCKGCNIYILATALNSRELDSCIDESGTIRTNLMPVVLCKDCVYRDPEDKKCDCGCWHFPFTTKDEDFCSYGKFGPYHHSEIKTSHGRLIDADRMIDRLEKISFRNLEEPVYPLTFKDLFDTYIYDLQHEPTIIPAEGDCTNV